jgi:hypothetical protein
MSPLSSVQLTVNFITENKQVVAYSPALDISTVGRSIDHAKVRFQELVSIFLKDITERNVIDEVLTDLGWHKAEVENRSQWVPPKVTSLDLQVPMAA